MSVLAESRLLRRIRPSVGMALGSPFPAMFEAVTQRRYLLPFKVARLPQQITDVLVIGGGVAGLRAAIAAAEGGAEVLLLAKDTIEQSNTWYAQGGIAARSE